MSTKRNKSKPASAPTWLLNKSYKNMELIGSGGFSRVFKATRFGEVQPKFVAIKVIRIKNSSRWSLANFRASLLHFARVDTSPEADFDQPMQLSNVIREISAWRQLTDAHVPYIINLLDTLDFHTEFWAIMELGEICVLEFLSQLRAEKITVGPKALRDLLSPIFIALRTMHNLGFVHRDIKPENIIICKGLVPKLSDFGSTRKFDKGKNLQIEADSVQTFIYAPPESYVKDGFYSETFDTWSLLLTMYTIYLGHNPWEAFSRLEEKEVGNEMSYISQLITQSFEPLNLSVAQIHLFQLLGLLKSAKIEKRTELYITGKPVSTSKENSEFSRDDYNSGIPSDFVEFFLSSLKILGEEWPKVSELCEGEYMIKSIERYISSSPEQNTKRLHQRIYKPVRVSTFRGSTESFKS